MHALDSMKKTI
jgi:flagellar basal body rod protein FlgB